MSHQPYRRGARQPGAPLGAMLRGKPLYLPHPSTAKRAVQKLAGTRRRRAKRRV